MKKLISLLCVFTFCSTFVSCNENKSPNEASETNAVVDEETDEKLINFIILDERLWNTNENSDANMAYTLLFPYPQSECQFTYKNNSCKFSIEKGEEIIKKYQSYEHEEYKPYHANEDGLMVTEYKPNTIQIMYVIPKKVNDQIVYKADEETSSGHFYTLSDEDYNDFVTELKHLEEIAENANVAN